MSVRIAQVLYNNLVLKHNTPLKTLQMDITSSCNLKCAGCYHESDRARGDKDNAFWKELINSYVTKDIKNVWLFGGEPTLNPEIIEYVHNKFPLVYIISNGTIPIDKKYNCRLYISLDGLEKTNDMLRGKGVFNKVLENYQNDKRVVINTCISKKNYMEIGALIAFVKKTLRVHGISFQFYSPREDAPQQECDEMLLTSKEMAVLERTFSRYFYDLSVFMTPKLFKAFSDKEVNFENCGYKKYVDSYYSDGTRKKCCNSGVSCENCRIVPPYLHHVLDVYKDPLTYVKFLNWL